LSEANANKSESSSALPAMRLGGIHVQHTYEVTELSVFPQGRNEIMKGINSTYVVPFDERSSKEQLVGAN